MKEQREDLKYGDLWIPDQKPMTEEDFVAQPLLYESNEIDPMEEVYADEYREQLYLDYLAESDDTEAFLYRHSMDDEGVSDG